jgi:hypothetical protein
MFAVKITMKKLIIVPVLALLFSCSPSKSDTKISVHVYCDSCFVSISNGGGNDSPLYFEPVYTGNVYGFASFEAYRFNANYNCFKMNDYYSLNSNPVTLIFIEEGDTISISNNNSIQSSYCF